MDAALLVVATLTSGTSPSTFAALCKDLVAIVPILNHLDKAAVGTYPAESCSSPLRSIAKLGPEAHHAIHSLVKPTYPAAVTNFRGLSTEMAYLAQHRHLFATFDLYALFENVVDPNNSGLLILKALVVFNSLDELLSDSVKIAYQPFVLKLPLLRDLQRGVQ